MVVWYHSPLCEDSPVVRENLVFSDELKHEYHAVHEFLMVGYTFLRQFRNIDRNKIPEFSDGCSTQFKSRGPFAVILNSLITFTISSFGAHIASHDGIEQFYSVYCDKFFTNSSNLSFHKISGVKKPSHKCKKCGKLFKKPSHKCKKCGNLFKAERYLNNHMQFHENP